MQMSHADLNPRRLRTIRHAPPKYDTSICFPHLADQALKQARFPTSNGTDDRNQLATWDDQIHVRDHENVFVRLCFFFCTRVCGGFLFVINLGGDFNLGFDLRLG